MWPLTMKAVKSAVLNAVCVPTKNLKIHQLEAFKAAIHPFTLDETLIPNDTRKIINALYRRSTLFPSEVKCASKGLYYYCLNRPSNELLTFVYHKYFDLYLTICSGYVSYEVIFDCIRRQKPHPLLNTVENPSDRELFLFLCHRAHCAMVATDAYRFLIPVCKAAYHLWTPL